MRPGERVMMAFCCLIHRIKSFDFRIRRSLMRNRKFNSPKRNLQICQKCDPKSRTFIMPRIDCRAKRKKVAKCQPCSRHQKLYDLFKPPQSLVKYQKVQSSSRFSPPPSTFSIRFISNALERKKKSSHHVAVIGFNVYKDGR